MPDVTFVSIVTIKTIKIRDVFITVSKKGVKRDCTISEKKGVNMTVCSRVLAGKMAKDV